MRFSLVFSPIFENRIFCPHTSIFTKNISLVILKAKYHNVIYIRNFCNQLAREIKKGKNERPFSYIFLMYAAAYLYKWRVCTYRDKVYSSCSGESVRILYSSAGILITYVRHWKHGIHGIFSAFKIFQYFHVKYSAYFFISVIRKCTDISYTITAGI